MSARPELAPVTAPGGSQLRTFLALLRSHDQTLLGVQPVDTLGVHLPAFAL